MALSCPDCNTELVDKTFFNIPINVCPKCAGIWLDGNDLYRIRVELNPDEILEIEVGVAPTPTAMAQPAHNPLCPVCHQALKPYHYMNGPVVLHTCDRVDGIWVQDKEMDKIASVDEPKPEALQVARQYADETEARVEHYQRVSQFFDLIRRRRGWPVNTWLPSNTGLDYGTSPSNTIYRGLKEPGR